MHQHFETWNMSHGNFGWWKLLFLIYAELFPYTKAMVNHTLLSSYFFFLVGGGGTIWIKFCDHFFEFYVSCCKKLVIVKRLFGTWGHAIVAVTIVKRFKLLAPSWIAFCNWLSCVLL